MEEAKNLKTHLRYIHLIYTETENISFTYNCLIQKTDIIIAHKKLQARIKLINLTQKSLKEEAKQVEEIKEYSIASSAWIAIKSYYLIFYLETILYSLIEDRDMLGVSHKKVRNFIKNVSESGDLSSNSTYFLKVLRNKDCEESGAKKGENLTNTASITLRYKQIMKKLRDYSKEDFKKSKNIEKLGGKKLITFNEQKLSLADFYYWYRIKSNYRDLSFVNTTGSDIKDVYRFYRMYNTSSLHVAAAYESLIKELYEKKTGMQLNFK